MVAAAAAADSCACVCLCQAEQQQQQQQQQLRVPPQQPKVSSASRVPAQARAKPSPLPPPLPPLQPLPPQPMTPPSLIKQQLPIPARFPVDKPRAGSEPISPRRLKNYQPTVHFQPEVVLKDNQAQASRMQPGSPATKTAPASVLNMAGGARYSPVISSSVPRPSPATPALVHAQPPSTPVAVPKMRIPPSTKSNQEIQNKRN
ncbi:hypothetical protein Ahia01_000609900 [Argonauta hians]